MEICALGIFHKNLGEDMGIPFDVLPSKAEGWADGVQFALELTRWTVQYEERVARFTATNDQYVRVYVDSALPRLVRPVVRRMLGAGLDEVMRLSLGWGFSFLYYVIIQRYIGPCANSCFSLESPGYLLSFVINLVQTSRKLFLRYLALPRPAFRAVKLVHDMPNQETKLYNFERKVLQPWYIRPTVWSKWGPGALLVRLFGGKVPGSRGDRYQPQGYDLMTIGPEPQRGRGVEEMRSDIEVIKARGVAMCPFSKAKFDHLGAN